MYDVAIIGGGPAGLTAAVYAARKQLRVFMVTMDLGGQTNLTADVANYMGFEYISGAELSQKFAEQVQQFPLTMRLGARAQRLTGADDHFVLGTSEGEEVQMRSAVICTGKRSRKLQAPGEEELVGRGVSYCATCDGPFFRGLSVLVVGGGNSGVTAAIDLSRVASAVTVVEVTDRWRADEILLEQARAAPHVNWLLEHQVLAIRGEREVESVLLAGPQGEQELAVQGVFIEIGLTPNTEWLQGLVQLNQRGEIEVNCQGRTSVPGLFAAGDVASTPQKQIIIAAGEGAKAALAAYDYLLRRGWVRPVAQW